MKRQTAMRSVVVILMIAGALAIAPPARATITNPVATIINDQNGDGIAGVGDTIEFSCNSDNATDGLTPYVNLAPLGTNRFVLPRIVVGNTYFSAIYTVSAGSYDGNYTPSFIDNTGPVPCGNSVNFDNQRPNSIVGPSVTGGTGPNGEFRIGDSMRVDITMSTPYDNDVPRINLSPIGLGATNIFGGVHPNYTYSRSFPLNREGNGTSLTVTATDDAGNSRNWTVAVDYDTKAPEITSVQASINSGNAVARLGDVITVRATVQNYDNETLVATSSALWGGQFTMPRISLTGTTAVYEIQQAIPAHIRTESTTVRVEVTATDDVGNTSTNYSNYLAVDTVSPQFNSSPQIRIVERGGILFDNIAIIGDTLEIRGDLSAIMDDTTVTVDLSGIGGVANQLLYKQPGSTSFSLDYQVHQYTSEDNIPRAFSVQARDTAGNLKYEITLPVIYVDNQPPSLSGATLQKVTAGGSTAKLGDTIRIAVNVTNPDNGAIWTDFRRIGGNGSDTLSPAGGSTHDLNFVVASPTAGFNPIDGTQAFTLWAVDNAGNQVSITSNQLSIDNDPPQISGAIYTVNPPLSPSHQWVRVGDRITFTVSLARGGASPYDGETVSMNLSSLGGASNQALTYDGAGNYSWTQTVAIGALNDNTNFVAIARDNAENGVSTTFTVPVDNYPPAPGPMTINWNRDVAKVGAINLGIDDGNLGTFNAPDRVEFIVPMADQDGGSCTIDLSLVGGSGAAEMFYDLALQRYYLLFDVQPATIENSAYVFRATVRDKAGNVTSSLSGPMEIDCVPPIIEWVQATLSRDDNGNNWANVGDQVTLTTRVDRARLDGGIPRVDVSALGGSSFQDMFDDGAHGDGAPNDGVFGWQQTVIKGTTNGQARSFTVSITDNGQNQVSRTTAPINVDNQPLAVTLFTAVQTFDNNGNTIVDLDGYYTTFPQIATDVVQLRIRVTGISGDLGQVTVDLTPLGINDPARVIPMSAFPGYWEGIASYQPIIGTTNRVNTIFNALVNDVNGNVTLASTSAPVMIDNLPPQLTVYPVAFVQDGGVQGEANQGDVIRIRVRVQNHDGILPQVDFANLFLANGLNPPAPVFFPPGGPNEYSYDWTVPQGLGTLSTLTILAYDQSGNMVVGYTNPIRFLSKVPAIKPFGFSRCDLSFDGSPPVAPNNRIANPGDEVTIRVTLDTVFNASNTPPATVLADIRTIASAPANDDPLYNDGDPNTTWVPLTYLGPPLSGPGNWVYQRVFPVGISRREVTVASFPVRVLHPDTNSVTMASTTIECDPNNPWGIDARPPDIYYTSIAVTRTNDDNVSSGVANIGDELTMRARIRDWEDPGSATVRLIDFLGNVIADLQLLPTGIEDWYSATLVVATHGVYPWSAPVAPFDRHQIRYAISASDDADNLSFIPSRPATFTVDNTPINLIDSQFFLSPNNFAAWVGNVGNGVASDGLVASVTCDAIGYHAYVDLTEITGTSSWPLDQVFNGGFGRFSNPYILHNPTIELGTYTFPIVVVETLSGNRTASFTQLAIDTTRPYVTRARYDGQYLWLDFSESLLLTPLPTADRFAQTLIRIGRRNDLRTLDASHTIQLTLDDRVEDTLFNGSLVQVALGSISRALISDWGTASLYLSFGTGNLDGEGATLTTDLAGNWLRPIPQRIPMPVEVIPFIARPNLIGGRYDAINDPTRLYLYFDRDMATDTFRDDTLPPLSVCRIRTNDSLPVDYTRRYTMRVGNDRAGAPVNSRELVVDLSPEAQDWIAVKFGRAAPNIYYAVATTVVPLARDVTGNRLNTISIENSVAADLSPENRGFDVQADAGSPLLNINSKVLTLHTSRRARIFADDFRQNEPIPTGKAVPNVVTSNIFIYRNADRSGPSIALIGATIDPALNDWASTTVNITLTDEHVRTILSWATGQIHIAIYQGALLDLWGNQCFAFPQAGNTVPVLLPPALYPGSPAIVTVAISDPPPTRKWNPGQLAFEVDLQVATLSTGIEVPINRNSIPEMEVWRQDGTGRLMVASFTGWSTHRVNGIDRTTALFTNRDTVADGLQLIPAVVVFLDTGPVAIGANPRRIEDVFGKTLPTFDPLHYRNYSADPARFGWVASMVYDLNQRVDVGVGYNGNQEPLVFDTQIPYPVSVSPASPTVLGITPIGSPIFRVDFNEVMDSTTGRNPTMRLRNNSMATVVAMNFIGWENGNRTARFANSSPVNADTLQGMAFYEVSGGYDLAGNPGANAVSGATWTIDIRSRGATITRIAVRTFQRTTAKGNTDYLTDQPFSPNVLPGVATITIDFAVAPIGTQFLHFYQGGSSRAQFPIIMTSPINGYVIWDGRFNGTMVTTQAPETFELRVIDDSGNEASARHTLVYDERSPEMLAWNISRARQFGGAWYFSPTVQGYMKADAFGPSAGQSLRMRALRLLPVPGSVDCYPMTPLTGSGYTVSWDGKSTDPGNPILQDGTYYLEVVDAAGNVGVPSGAAAQATATVVIDTVVPAVATLATLVNGAPRSRFNPNVGLPLRIDVTMNVAPPEASGTLLARIMAGANVIRDLSLGGAHPVFTCNWDGRDAGGALVPDGTYRIRVIDLAENMSPAFLDIDVITSVFKVTAVEEVNRRRIRVTFSTEVDPDTLGLATNYSLSPSNPAGIGVVAGGPIVAGRVVTLPLNLDLVHDLEYTLTCNGTTIDGDTLQPPNNTGSFRADARGPLIDNVTFDGVSSQRQFNVVFDEQIERTSAVRLSNYTLTTSSTTLALTQALLRGDNRSVQLSTNADLVEGVNYTLVASGVRDLFENPSNGNLSRRTFTGRDVNPPVLTVSVFSNPANEFDVVVTVRSNEDLGAAPSAQVIQSGGAAVSLPMSAGPTNRLYIGGAHLDPAFPGVAQVRVTAKDLAGNEGNSTLSFSTAYVNSSIRAQISSTDGRFRATFAPGSLNSPTWVSVVAVPLAKSAPTQAGGGIRASTLADLDRSALAKIRLAAVEGVVGSELEPTGAGYSLHLPAGRLLRPVPIEAVAPGGAPLPVGQAWFRLDGDGQWRFVSRGGASGTLRTETGGAGTWAILRDTAAPEYRLLTALDPLEPLRTPRPVIEWQFQENGAGVDPTTVIAKIDGREQPVAFDAATGRASVRPAHDLIGGYHRLEIEAADLAGNRMPSRVAAFAVQPPLQVLEVQAFPNPARSFSKVRVALNRADVLGDLIEARIYDVSGTRVRLLDSVSPVPELTAGGQRQLYDLHWDLTNDDGQRVANGVYLLRLRVRDPEGDRTVKSTHKLVVLR